MDSIFKISKLGEFGLLIEGLESDAGQYLSPDNVSVSYRAYRWDHSVTVNTLAALNSEGSETFISYTPVDHLTCCDDRSEIQLDKDGLYKVGHFIIPNKAWYDHAKAVGENFELYDTVYYYDNLKFYKIVNNIAVEVPFDEVYNATDINTIVKSEKTTFAMYYLNSCFSKLLKDLLSGLPWATGGNCQRCKSPSLSDKERDRDLIWMFINVIKYNLELGRLYEAQRFLEKLNRCNSICSDLKPIKIIGCGC